MEAILLAFITGLTTGGLSCLAVQGGLLAGSLARQIEQDLSVVPAKPVSRRQAATPVQPRTQTALPIALFLLAKLVAYTLLGALLGLAGSYLTLSPVSRAVLMIAIGVFMVGNALRMFNVHPIFRYFVIEPPRFITRTIRRTARQGTVLFTPLFLGALTVLIPCGVTQVMMAAALGTGNPAAGAALMFAFTLGTSPLFFLVAYLTTQIGKRLESYFLRFVAVVVLILGLVTLDSGLNLLGSPVSFASITRSLRPSSSEIAAPQPTTTTTTVQTLELRVANAGYFPNVLYAPANQEVRLDLVTNKTYSCARDFVIPALKYYQLLPDTGRVTVNIPPQKPGTVMRFTCSMGMYTGQIVFLG
ncbi:MAG: sulfite exporter TauE/SafE family protein [Anaerolineae bacterium]|nr:sulfite exporter TauE/SafE family protein [Anaerolineae bacterium]